MNGIKRIRIVLDYKDVHTGYLVGQRTAMYVDGGVLYMLRVDEQAGAYVQAGRHLPLGPADNNETIGQVFGRLRGMSAYGFITRHLLDSEEPLDELNLTDM